MDMPDFLVTPESVEARFYRALTPDEKRVLPAWIEDAWDELLDVDYLRLAVRLPVSNPEDRLLGKVARTIRASLVRRLQNPQGRRQFSYTVDDATVSETMASETLAVGWFTEGELAKLAPGDSPEGAFTIRTYHGALNARRGEVDPWTSP